MNPALVLVHSPLVGPLTWMPVSDELRRLGQETLVASLPSPEAVEPPYWRRFAQAVAAAVEPLSPDRPILLAGHSNSGPRLPSYAEAAGRRVDGYIFVDADLPGAAAPRHWLEEMRRRAVDGMVESWPEEALQDEIPDQLTRASFMAELAPAWPLALFEEPAPVFAGWPDAPCAYLQLTDRYPEATGRAAAQGWPLVQMEGSHFEMLANPRPVAEALVELIDALAR